MQTQAELQAQYGEGGAVAAANHFVRAVLDGDLKRAWAFASPEFREHRVWSWLEANANHILVGIRDREEVTSALVGGDIADPLWSGFALTEIRQFREAFADVDWSTWGYASRPRIIGPDQELVLLVNRGSDDRTKTFDGPTIVQAHGFVMAYIDGSWLVSRIAGDDDMLPLSQAGDQTLDG